MKNLMVISVTPSSKKQIKTIAKYIFPSFYMIRVTKSFVKLRKNCFSKAIKISLLDFLEEIIPRELNTIADSKNIESPVPYYANVAEFLLYLDSIGERNLISYLWNCYIHIESIEVLRHDTVDTVADIIPFKVIKIHNIKKVIRDLKYMYDLMKDFNLNIVVPTPLHIVHKSPDIRGSPVISFQVVNRATG